jgi:hypothetical protein
LCSPTLVMSSTLLYIWSGLAWCGMSRVIFAVAGVMQSSLWADGLLWLLTAIRLMMTIWLCSTLFVFWPQPAHTPPSIHPNDILAHGAAPKA